MSSKFIIASCILFFGFSNVTNAQLGFSHEIGIIAGPVAFQSDYGKRADMKTDSGNSGFGIGIIHYMNFSYTAECNCYAPETYFNDHFKVRSELSFNKTDLNHIGKWVEGKRTYAKEQLKAMHGSTAVTNIGMQLEWFPWSIREFSETVGSWAPFLSFGGQFCYYDPEVKSDMGPLGSIVTTFPKYLFPSEGKPYGYSNDSGTTWSLIGSVGTRYKLTELSDLMIDFRLQYYASDWVDGLNENRDIFTENKANDWLAWLNVGYIYYIE